MTANDTIDHAVSDVRDATLAAAAARHVLIDHIAVFVVQVDRAGGPQLHAADGLIHQIVEERR